MYLRKDAIGAVLRSVAQFPEGSKIVLTFASASNTPRLIAERAAQTGEPRLTLFEPAEMCEELRAAGCWAVDLLTPDAASERYFRSSSLPTPQRTTIVAAVR